MASSRNISVSVFCRESGGEDCGLCLSLPTSHNCGWCSTVGVCTTLNQCKLDPFTTQVRSTTPLQAAHSTEGHISLTAAFFQNHTLRKSSKSLIGVFFFGLNRFSMQIVDKLSLETKRSSLCSNLLWV